jgi:hypothetical protein
MQVEATITSRTVIDKFSAMPERLDALVRQSVQAVSLEAVRELTGRDGLSKYGRHKRGTPTPSPAGEPPAQVSTMLRKSVAIMPVRRVGFAHYTQSTMPTMVYARVQELGDPSRNIPARPFVRPARDRMVSSGKVREIFAKKLIKEMNKRG